jgi:hypothetical protein
MSTMLMVSTNPPVALVPLPTARRIVEMVSHFENFLDKSMKAGVPSGSIFVGTYTVL